MNCETRSSCLTSDRALNGHADWKRKSDWSGTRGVAGVFVGHFTQPIPESQSVLLSLPKFTKTEIDQARQSPPEGRIHLRRLKRGHTH